jgi:hypothetical protein
VANTTIWVAAIAAASGLSGSVAGVLATARSTRVQAEAAIASVHAETTRLLAVQKETRRERMREVYMTAMHSYNAVAVPVALPELEKNKRLAQLLDDLDDVRLIGSIATREAAEALTEGLINGGALMDLEATLVTCMRDDTRGLGINDEP